MTNMQQLGSGDDHASMRSAEDLGAEHLRELLIADRVSTAVGVLTLIIISAATSVNAAILTLIAIVTAMGVVRQFGLRSLGHGRTDMAVIWFAAGSWGVSIGAVVIIPMALPIVVLTLAIPAVLSAIYQQDQHVRWIGAGLVLSSAIAGIISRQFEGAGLEDELPSAIVTAVFVGFLAVQNVPLVMAVRYASRHYRMALGEAVAASEVSRRAEAEVVRSRARLAQSADTERRRIERDLHDGAQQLFVSTLVQLRVFGETIKRGRDAQPDAVNTIADDLEAAIDELRRLARGIYPSLLQTRGFYEALHGLARSVVTPTRVLGEDPGRLPHEIETALYFLTSEALQNVAKHAGSGAEATVMIEHVDGHIELRIEDDGVGMEPSAQATASRGISNMQDRVAAVGGTLTTAGTPGQGCCVTATVPTNSQATLTSSGLAPVGYGK